MAYFLYGLFFVSCIVLVAAVLLQPGKTDAGALFTSNISSSAFKPRGAQSALSKMTIVAATLFMVSALLLSMPALTGNTSVLETSGDAPVETAPVIDPNSNTDANASAPVEAAPNANVAVPANAEAEEAVPPPAEGEKPAEPESK